MRSYSLLHDAVVLVDVGGLEARDGKERQQSRDRRSGSGGCWSIRAARGSRSQGRSQRRSCSRRACAGRCRKRSGRGSASGSPSRLASSVAAASSSLRYRLRVDVAVAGAVLQRDAPLPAGAGARSSACTACSSRRAIAGHRDRAVAGQPVRPVVVAGLQRAFDQQAAKARAVDEQIALDRVARSRSVTCATSPSPSRMPDVDDLAFDAPHAARLGIAAQVARVQRRRRSGRRRRSATAASSACPGAGA